MTATAGWAASRVRAYDCGIETNHDAWRAVHEGLRDGLSLLEISERTGLSYQMVGVYRRQSRPAGIRRKINSSHEGAHRCADCGGAVAHTSNGRGPSRCQRCAHRIQSAHTTGRTENLRAWALRHGHVPDVNTAATFLGVSRSIAGDAVRAAFGPDPREGGQRRASYRGWPEGAPDVPRPDEVERMREHGRVYGGRNAEALRGARRIRRGTIDNPIPLAEFERLLIDGRRGRFVITAGGRAVEVRA